MVSFLRQVRLGAVALLLFPSAWLTAQSLKPIPELVQYHRDGGTPFETVRPFAPSGKLDDDAARFAPDAQFLTLSPTVLTQIAASRPEALTLLLPFHGQTLTLDLVQQDPLTADFSVLTSTSGELPVDYQPGVHYRGVLRGDDHSIAAFSFFEGEIAGMVSSDRGGDQVLGRLETPGNRLGYVLYSDAQLDKPNPFACHTADAGDWLDEADPDADTRSADAVNGCVRVFFEVDHALFQNKGSVQATVNYLSSVFNQLATLYANESVSTKLSQVFVWTTPDFYSTTSSSSALIQFQGFRKNYNADLAHLVGIAGNNLGGIAYVDVLCFSNYAYAYSDITPSYSNVPTYSWTVEVMTHEMGHNLGSNHTQWCGWSGGALDNCYSTEGGCPPGPQPSNGGTIMSYCHLSGTGINFNNGFGTQPGNKIRNEVSGAGCLAATCAPANSCNAPAGITVSNITGSGAMISWTAVSGASSYSLQWRAVGATSWNTISSAVSPQALTGLPLNDEIEVTVRANCGSNNSGYVNGVIFKTGASGGGGGGGECNAPSGITATGTSSSTASVSWSTVNGATAYRISWKTTSSGNWGTEVTIGGTTYNISGLAPSTSYNVRVRSVCGNTFSSYVTTTFTTQGSGGGGGNCNTPSGLAASNITNNKAKLSWMPANGAFSYDLQIKKSTSANWTTFVGLPVTVVQVTGLQSSMTYQVRVRAKCSGNTYSSYSNIVSFTTQAYLPGSSEAHADDRGELLQLDLDDPTAGDTMTLQPNPAQDRVAATLRLHGANARVDVLDLFGKVLLSAPAQPGNSRVEFDLGALPAGLYVVRASSDGEVRLVQRLVKQ